MKRRFGKEDCVNKNFFKDSLEAGFTLLELLVVIIVVGTLVTIALPKYQNALERGRALEGLRNVQYMAEYAAAKHMASGKWPTADETGRLKATDVVKSRFFGEPNLNTEEQTVTIYRRGDWDYHFVATIVDDVVTSVVCGGNDCETLDLAGANLMKDK